MNGDLDIFSKARETTDNVLFSTANKLRAIKRSRAVQDCSTRSQEKRSHMHADKPFHSAHSEALNRVTAALNAKNIGLATDLALRAIADGFENPLFLNLRAFCLENEGRDAEALSDLRRASVLAPHDPHILNALGLAYSRCGHHDDAIEAFEAATTEEPNFSQAHFNSGWSREEVGDLATAKQCYLRAHETQRNAAEPLGHLANLAARRGAWTEVRGYAEQALTFDRDNAAAVLALGKLEIEQGAFGKAEKRLRAFLGHPT